jgi:hypothetical protein
MSCDLPGDALLAGQVVPFCGDSPMTEPTIVDTPCRECRAAPVELLKVIRKQRYLWCPKCHAIWVDPDWTQ